MSKIVEYVMHSQLMHYFTSNKLFSSQQYGFQANRSIELAALELMDRNINNMNKNITPINIYVDLIYCNFVKLLILFLREHFTIPKQYYFI